MLGLINESSSHMVQVPFKLLFLCWVLERLYFLEQIFCSLYPYGSPGSKSNWFSRPDDLGAHLHGTVPKNWVPDMGHKALTP